MTEIEKIKLAKKLGIDIAEINNALEEEDITDNVILVTENNIPVALIDPERVDLSRLIMRRRYNSELQYYAFSYNCAPSLSRDKNILMSLFVTLHEDRRNMFFIPI